MVGQLFPPNCGIQITSIADHTEGLTLLAQTTHRSANCPACGSPSDHVHSRYPRTLRDLPMLGKPFIVVLTVRRFRCVRATCSRQLFTEALTDYAKAFARATDRLQKSQGEIAHALGGEAGSRLATKLGMPVSGDTLLRRLRPITAPPTGPIRVVGIDDFAFRRGHTYGTIVCDLETHRPVELLPNRDAATVATWLRKHPQIRVVSRDRAACYALAATDGAPQAIQVADRWHLLKNFREALERWFQRHTAILRPILESVAAPAESSPAPAPSLETVSEAPSPENRSESCTNDARQARFEEVRRLHQSGVSIRQIVRQTRLHDSTVRRYLREAKCPDWRTGTLRPTALDPWRDWVDHQLVAGNTNGSDLHRQLQEQGCHASAVTVRRFVTRRLAAVGRRRERANAAAAPKPIVPSPKQLAFDLLCRPERRSPEQVARVERIGLVNEESATVLRLTKSFTAMVRRESKEPGLRAWMDQAEAGCSELKGFVAGLRAEQPAIEAALTQPWSNGPVEGQVGRLKCIKRSMFGRASLALLRARVLPLAK